jgi:hypothetical protein
MLHLRSTASTGSTATSSAADDADDEFGRLALDLDDNIFPYIEVD